MNDPPPIPARAAVPRILRPLVRFLETEAAGGVVLLVCAAAALAVANSPWAGRYHDFWHARLNLRLLTGDAVRLELAQSLEWWINDGLMTLFFFVVGLEIKRELIRGELRDPRKAALPAAAALGGMVVPALIYVAVIGRGEGHSGWGIPMATDIAFVVGVLALLGPRVPPGLKILLLSLAIVDDLGAVLVIAVAYTQEMSLPALALAGGGLALVALLQRLGVRATVVYVVVGFGVWVGVARSGVHPTVAGVLLGLLTPAGSAVGKERLLAVVDVVRQRLAVQPPSGSLQGFDDEAQALVDYGRNALAPLDRLQAALHPWVAFLIMPLFALANAGVAVDPGGLTSPVAVAVALGLVVGKPIGIVLFSWAAVRLGVARLPAGVTPRVLIGAGCLGGIGFTMSLFIAGLGLDGPLLTAGKVGTLTGSLISAALGSAVLLWVLPARTASQGG